MIFYVTDLTSEVRYIAQSARHSCPWCTHQVLTSPYPLWTNPTSSDIWIQICLGNSSCSDWTRMIHQASFTPDSPHDLSTTNRWVYQTWPVKHGRLHPWIHGWLTIWAVLKIWSGFLSWLYSLVNRYWWHLFDSQSKRALDLLEYCWVLPGWIMINHQTNHWLLSPRINHVQHVSSMTNHYTRINYSQPLS